MNPRIQTRAAETTADPRWAQVLARAPAADGHFVYSVRSTGVFCRPSCGARSPRPENVAFHASAADAQAAGFRPCRRCRPDQPPLAEQHAARIAELCRFIENAEAPPSLAELAVRAGLSRHHLHRVFKAITGLTPRDYAAAHRARRLRDELGRSASITDAILDAGYPSTGRFYAHSTEVLGMTPTTWRAGGADTDIRFAIGQSTLGAILVAASPRGVCAIALGDDPEQLAHNLQNRFPHARLIGAERDFEDWVARVVGFVEAPGSGLELPLDIRGTAFQQRVWQALRAIPPGTTLSYTELARRLGVPQSCRAVASACAANPLALVIPCHRVVRSDGGLAGYRWGVERKGELIKREAGQ